MRRLVVALVASAIACGGSVDGSPFPTVDLGAPPADEQSDPNVVTPDEPVPEEPLVEPDPPPMPTDDRVPVVIAQGHVGRTIMTCNGGQTWVADRSNNDATRCWIDGSPNYKECDHDTGAGRGITSTGTAFVANFGWGLENNVARRSVDGLVWTAAELISIGVGGINAAHAVVVAPGNSVQRSTDDGVSFEAIRFSVSSSIRRTGYADYDGGRFLAIHDDGLLVSADNGATWFAPRTYPSGCGGSATQTQGGVAYLNGIILIVGGGGTACRSTDGGVTWARASIGENVTSHLTTDGRAFYTWGWGVTLRSTDGEHWTSTPMEPGLYLGPAIYDPHNAVFVAVNDDYYDAQRFYRSTDGISWQTLSRGAAKGSHPIRAMAFGYVRPSAACP